MSLSAKLAPEAAAADSTAPDQVATMLHRLRRLGVTSREQPLLCVPKGYADFSKILTFKEALSRFGIAAEEGLFPLNVSKIPFVVTEPSRRVVLSATDNMLSVAIVVFDVPGMTSPIGGV